MISDWFVFGGAPDSAFDWPPRASPRRPRPASAAASPRPPPTARPPVPGNPVSGLSSRPLRRKRLSKSAAWMWKGLRRGLRRGCGGAHLLLAFEA
eukprot:1025716-Prorocentrum_minimum.AAC.1